VQGHEYFSARYCGEAAAGADIEANAADVDAADDGASNNNSDAEEDTREGQATASTKKRKRQKRSRCQFEGGCDKQTHFGNLCWKHSPKETCAYEDCTNIALRMGGMCRRHKEFDTADHRPDEVYPCAAEGCNEILRRRAGMVGRRPAMCEACRTKANERDRCSVEGCTNIVINNGVCIRHGAETKKYVCKMDGCSRLAVKKGCCWSHSPKEICCFDGCQRLATRPDASRGGRVCAKHHRNYVPKPPKQRKVYEHRYTCTVEGCLNVRVNSGLCRRHGAKVKQCSVEGCENEPVESQADGGRCRVHGGTQRKKDPNETFECRRDGCTGIVKRRGGVCDVCKNAKEIHMCSFDGCTEIAKRKGGLCDDHKQEKERKICKKHGCGLPSAVGGRSFCVTHFGEWMLKCKKSEIDMDISLEESDQEPMPKRRKMLCNREGCTEVVHRKGGVCENHKKPGKCSVDGCSNQSLSAKTGLCKRHANSNNEIYTCKRDGCAEIVKRKGNVCEKCKPHHAKCRHEGCTKLSQGGGLCIEHGARPKRYECNEEGCSKRAIKGGYCWSHATIEKCIVNGCTNQALSKKAGLCHRHRNGEGQSICIREGCTKTVARFENECMECKSRDLQLDDLAKMEDGLSKQQDPKTKKYECTAVGCSKWAVKRGYCWSHATIDKCNVDGCSNQAKKKGGMCTKHCKEKSLHKPGNCDDLPLSI